MAHEVTAAEAHARNLLLRPLERNVNQDTVASTGLFTLRFTSGSSARSIRGPTVQMYIWS